MTRQRVSPSVGNELVRIMSGDKTRPVWLTKELVTSWRSLHPEVASSKLAQVKVHWGLRYDKRARLIVQTGRGRYRLAGRWSLLVSHGPAALENCQEAIADGRAFSLGQGPAGGTRSMTWVVWGRPGPKGLEEWSRQDHSGMNLYRGSAELNLALQAVDTVLEERPEESELLLSGVLTSLSDKGPLMVFSCPTWVESAEEQDVQRREFLHLGFPPLRTTVKPLPRSPKS